MGRGVLIGVEVGTEVGSGVSVGAEVMVGAAIVTSSVSGSAVDPQPMFMNRIKKMGNKARHNRRSVPVLLVLRSLVIISNE